MYDAQGAGRRPEDSKVGRSHGPHSEHQAEFRFYCVGEDIYAVSPSPSQASSSWSKSPVLAGNHVTVVTAVEPENVATRKGL